ncbi:aminotransferase class V-fold PLP-dependent enzyme, partial [Candidatus Bathyarchaeota archaeon]|nr:aminotransferase class V-fold PLP-dependent enzyme [Candidatus Bathyarchaeota archaeon]
YHGDAHTSLVGIREVAKAGYACFDRDEEVEDWIETGNIGRGEKGVVEHSSPTRLLAYPGQSNMTGRRLPISWPGRLRKSALDAHTNTYTLLDAAALASTAQLDLSNADDAPDFVALSFYKIFGFPDLGALLVRRELGPMLQRRKYFGGGTVEMVLNGMQWHSLHAENPHEYLEDGTLPFHNIIALGHAMAAHERLYTSQRLVSQYTARLAKYLYESMASLRHADGTPLCVIYKDAATTYGDSSSTGPTVAFNLRYADGTWVRLDDLETLAKKASIHLRTGGVCNPGGIARALDLAPWEFLRNYVAGTRCGHGPVVLGGKPSGIARVSLGAMSSVGDVDALIKFLKGKFMDVLPEDGGALEWTVGMGLQVAGVLIYPLDGAGAWRVSDDTPWPVEESGLRWDKTWNLIDMDTGEVLTRESAPRMLLLSPEVDVEGGVLRVTPHKSLHPTKSGDKHLCLPLEDVAGAMQRAACVHCAAGDLQMAAKTVRRGEVPVPARVCESENVVAFFSAALGRRCTVARVERPSSRATLGGHHPERPSSTIVVVEDAPPSSPLTQESETSGTLVSSSPSGSERSTASPDPDSNRPLGEALAESMQANIILAQRPEATNLIREENWLFLAMGSRCTDVRHSPAPFFSRREAKHCGTAELGQRGLLVPSCLRGRNK